MKLKKIASLALAGVMAVGMLAGCSTAAGTGSNNGTTTTTTTSVVEAINNGQNAANDVKVTFTDSTSLDAALQKIVGEDGFTSVDADKIEYMTGIKAHKISDADGSWSTVNGWSTTDGFMVGANTKNDTMTTSNVNSFLTKVEDGDVFTAVKAGKVNGLNAEAAEKQVAAIADAMISELSASTYDAQKPAANEKYLDYSYDGNAALTSYTDANGATSYYYVVVLNQTVSVKTMPKK